MKRSFAFLIVVLVTANGYGSDFDSPEMKWKDYHDQLSGLKAKALVFRRMKHSDAQAACDGLDGSWRLPDSRDFGPGNRQGEPMDSQTKRFIESVGRYLYSRSRERPSVHYYHATILFWTSIKAEEESSHLLVWYLANEAVRAAGIYGDGVDSNNFHSVVCVED